MKWVEELEDITCFKRGTKSLNERELEFPKVATPTNEPRIEKTYLELEDPSTLVVSLV